MQAPPATVSAPQALISAEAAVDGEIMSAVQAAYRPKMTAADAASAAREAERERDAQGSSPIHLPDHLPDPPPRSGAPACTLSCPVGSIPVLVAGASGARRVSILPSYTASAVRRAEHRL